MVLGAGVMQVPLIKKIREMGHEAVVLGIKGNYPGLAHASKVIFENFTDRERTLAAARAEGIDAIMTCGIDLPVRTMAYVSEKLGLPGISAEAGEMMTDKARMQECFSRGGVRTARHTAATSLEEGVKAAAAIGYPVMFKAVDSQGSNGIVKVIGPQEAPAAYEKVLSATRLPYFLVEEFLEGEEFGAQAFVNQGRLEFVLPHGDYVFQGDTGVPLGHYAPCDYSPEILEDCRTQIELCIRAAGLSTCAINIDFMLCRGQVYVLELGARCGATMLAETVSLYYGFDYYEQMVRASLGEPADFSDRGTGSPSATMTLYSPVSGTITAQENRNLPDPRLVTVHFDKQVGDHAEAFRKGLHRLGHVIVKGETKAAAEAYLKLVLNNISITVA